jgi:TPR repeat protein
MLLGMPAWAGFEEGLAAYDKKDYQTALTEFRKAAEQGDADAQFNLGWMYADGQGVLQDFKTAVTWYRQAAEQGHACPCAVRPGSDVRQRLRCAKTKSIGVCAL